MKKGAPSKLIVGGKRLDGRKPEEMRKLEADVRILKRANGSGYFRMGNTAAIAAVYGPREVHPRHKEEPLKALLRCHYDMIPFSTKERARPGPSRRSTEISKVITDTFNSVVFLQEFPKTAIDVFVRIIQADAGTRCVAINAVSLALADAGIPMSDLVAACAAGKVDGQLVLDLFGLEDNYGEVDLPIAWLPSSKKIILLQMDGILSIDEFKKALELAKVGCEQVHACQVKALKKKFEGVDLE